MEIRDRSDADLDGCVPLLREVHDVAAYPVNWPADPRAWLTPADRLGAWVADLDGRVVGHVVLTADGPAGASVERLFVDPKATRAGVGRALLDHCVVTAAALGRKLVLEVVDRPGSPAIALYRRAGWQETGRTPIDWGGAEASHLLHFTPPPD
ncbi:GNAT family N-acetyltransferase [Kribbella sandramycini]|uniref:GNAT family N-acetyltransferase n=1 Tax=Kribbella sandramycini TaxID=60450 RepID=A0A7Y4L0U8_9ACTN|nr:GNAT family N-acetyltransferase [Kribbella sandramycini]MBB6564561.1 GNAT superfamily N-acetyltransferase [Kribbella sandramycini]NOL42265.1 GNAT family N-acetyltransferase [Kribbella sandramycini]